MIVYMMMHCIFHDRMTHGRVSLRRNCPECPRGLSSGLLSDWWINGICNQIHYWNDDLFVLANHVLTIVTDIWAQRFPWQRRDDSHWDHVIRFDFVFCQWDSSLDSSTFLYDQWIRSTTRLLFFLIDDHWLLIWWVVLNIVLNPIEMTIHHMILVNTTTFLYFL